MYTWLSKWSWLRGNGEKQLVVEIQNLWFLTTSSFIDVVSLFPFLYGKKSFVLVMMQVRLLVIQWSRNSFWALKVDRVDGFYRSTLSLSWLGFYYGRRHRLTCGAHFVPLCLESMMVAELAWLFLHHIFRYHGLLDAVLSDRGSLFISKFWRGWPNF